MHMSLLQDAWLQQVGLDWTLAGPGPTVKSANPTKLLRGIYCVHDSVDMLYVYYRMCRIYSKYILKYTIHYGIFYYIYLFIYLLFMCTVVTRRGRWIPCLVFLYSLA